MAESRGQPWLKKKRWRDGRVRDGVGGQAVILWILFIVGGGAAGVLFNMFVENGRKWISGPAVFAIVCGVAAIIFLTCALLKTGQWIRFGDSVFEMVTFPGVIGGQLVGVVYTKVKLQAADGFDVSLNCIKYVQKGGRDNERVQKIVVWHEEQHLVRGAFEEDNTRTAIPVGFRIPRDCPPTFSAAGYNDICWKLEVRAKVPGLDYRATFEVPVFVTGDSDSPDKSTVDPIAPYRGAS
jgi:hypothetical protein